MDVDGVAEGISPENPFEGSWAGIYEVAEFGVVGIVEFDVSKTGVLRGAAFNEEGGYGRDLVARVDPDGSMYGAAVPLAPGLVGEPYSGHCSIDEHGNMVCDLIGCILSDCFGLLVTVEPVVVADAIGNDEADTPADTVAGDTAGLTACEAGSYHGATSGAGRTRSIARQEALALASAYCNGTCGLQDGCSDNKPACKGAVKLSDMVCEGPTTLGRVACDAAFACTCSCSRNP